MVEARHNAKQVFGFLAEIPDPEIPVISIVDLGIVRSVNVSKEVVEVSITPTYNGCPAMKMITEEIYDVLKKHGIAKSKVKLVYAPAWSTDWISEKAKTKLKEYGIAPPEKRMAGNITEQKPKKCPYCNSESTVLKSEFGSTLCKALYYCKSCQQSFEAFKCI